MTKYSLAEICTRPSETLQDKPSLTVLAKCDTNSPWNVFETKSKSISDMIVSGNPDSCPRCNAKDSLIVQNSYQVCTICGWTASEPQCYQLPYTENTYSPQVLLPQYDKAAKSKNQIKILAIRDIESVFKNKTDVERIVQNLPNPNEPTIPEIECSMKTCGIKLIEYSHLIYQKQRNLGPNIFTSEEIAAFEFLINVVAEKFEEARLAVAPTRMNFLGKKFLVYKIIEFLGRTDILPQLQTFKSVVVKALEANARSTKAAILRSNQELRCRITEYTNLLQRISDLEQQIKQDAIQVRENNSVREQIQQHITTKAVSARSKRGTLHKNAWLTTLLCSQMKILQIHFEPLLYPGWPADIPFLIFLDAPCNAKDPAQMKIFLRNMLLLVHPDKATAKTNNNLQGIIVGFVQHLKNDVCKLNKMGNWSVSARKSLAAYTDMIGVFRNEAAWTDKVQLRLTVGAYMDAAKRNCGA